MITKANKSDLFEITDLIIQMYVEGGYQDILRDDAKAFILQTYQDLYDKGRAQHFIIKSGSGSKIVSCAGAFIKTDMLSTFKKTPHFGFITNVYTAPKHRNQGHATLLATRAIDWLFENKIEDVRLISTKDSRRIYEKMGFKSTDEMILSGNV